MMRNVISTSLLVLACLIGAPVSVSGGVTNDTNVDIVDSDYVKMSTGDDRCDVINSLSSSRDSFDVVKYTKCVDANRRLRHDAHMLCALYFELRSGGAVVYMGDDTFMDVTSQRLIEREDMVEDCANIVTNYERVVSRRRVNYTMPIPRVL